MEKMVNLKGREDLAQTIEHNNTGCVAAEIFLQYVSTSFPFPTLSTDFLYPELTPLDLCVGPLKLACPVCCSLSPSYHTENRN